MSLIVTRSLGDVLNRCLACNDTHVHMLYVCLEVFHHLGMRLTDMSLVHVCMFFMCFTGRIYCIPEIGLFEEQYLLFMIR